MGSPSHDGSAVPSRLPIVAAPMAGGPSAPELVAAVSAAGGFGFLAAGYLTPDALAAAVERTRTLTDAPFGVNLFVPSPSRADGDAVAAYAAGLEADAARLGTALGEPRWDDDAWDAKLALAEGVHTVSFTFGRPEHDVVERLHRRGSRVAVTVTSVEEARRCDDADVLVVQGTEAGGHQGTFDPDEQNTTALADALAAIADASRQPLVAAGGITSAAHVERALAAGAAAVQVGTALLCATEAGTSAVHRQAMLQRTYADTELTRAFSGRWGRGLVNRFVREHVDAPGGYPQLHHLTRPLRAAAAAAGEADLVNLWAGTGWRSARSASAAEIVAELAAMPGRDR